MKNLYIYCEGKTEEGFVNEVLCPYLINMSIYTRPIICATKRTKTKKFKGGVSNYQKFKDELIILCKQHKNEMVTTMFDYYRLPNNSPGIKDSESNLYKKVKIIEKEIEADIGMPNLFFNLMVHEFEGLLFTNILAFQIIADDNIILQLQSIKEGFESPEHINDSVDTAPSKRIEALIPGYKKVLDGVDISKDIGVDAMLAECRHFREWVQRIEQST